MKSMFSEESGNKLKSAVLMTFFILIIGVLGGLLGFVYGNVYFGLAIAVIFSIFYSLFGFFAGSQMILGVSGAKPVTKKDYPYLYNTIEGLAVASGMPAPRAYVIDDSALNAFSTGRDPKNASITVTTGLLKTMNRQELEGVIGHEMSHIKNYDIRVMMLTAVLIGVVVLLSDFLLRTFLWGGARRNRNDNSRGNQLQMILIIAGLALAVLSPIISQLIQLAISRKREFAADAGSAILTRYPPGLASALGKIAKDPDPLVDKANRATAHLFISSPFRKTQGFFTNLFSTHPPIPERIKRLEEM